MTQIGRILLTVWGAAFSILWCSYIGLSYCLLRPFERRGEWYDRQFQQMCRVLLRALRVRLVVEGADRFPADRPVILMSNHRSYLDIPALSAAFPGHSVRFVAKKSLGWIPFLGWAIALSPCILIDREDARSSLKRIQAGAKALPPGAGLAIFPEGTRCDTDAMLPFKKGAFLLAVGSGVPVLPVSVRGSGAIWGKGALLFRPGTIRVLVHPVIELPEGQRKATAGLLGHVRETIAAGLDEG